MLKVFMLVAILLTTGFGVQYAYFANFKSTTITQNEMSAGAITNKLKSYAIKQGNSYVMPYGVNEDGYHQLPTYISGSRVTRSGIPFVYCPFSQQVVINDDVVVDISDEESYAVDILNSSITQGRDYVVASVASPIPDVVALVISPEKRSNIPDCRDVEVNSDGRYVLGGDSARLGRVHAVTVHDIQTSSRVNVEYVDPANTEALSAAFQEVSNSPAEDHIIVLRAGATYTFSESYNFSPLYLGKKGSVIIRGESVSSPSIINASVATNLAFSQMLVTIENISFSNTIKISAIDSDLKMRAVSGGLVNATNSKVSFLNVGLNGNTRSESGLILTNSTVTIASNLSVTSSANPAFYIQDSDVVHTGGNLTIGTSNGSVGLQMLNTKWSSRAANLNFSVNSGIAQALVYVDSESAFVASGGTASGSGSLSWGVFSLGVLQLDSYSLTLNTNVGVGIHLGIGSRSRLTNTTIGAPSFPVTVGIDDVGSISTSGQVGIFGSTCFGGAGFSREVTQTIPDSVVTQVNPDFSVIVGSIGKSVNLDVTSNFNSLQTDCF